MRKRGRHEDRSKEGRELGGREGVRDKGREKGRVGVFDGGRERERGRERRREGGRGKRREGGRVGDTFKHNCN